VVVEEKVQAVLVAAGGVTAIVPAARIKLPGDWQELPRPYIVHFPVSMEATHVHNEGLMALRAWPFYQVSCFGNTYSSAKAAAVAVRDALGDYKGSDGTAVFLRSEHYGGFDANVKVHQIIQEYDVWEAL